MWKTKFLQNGRSVYFSFHRSQAEASSAGEQLAKEYLRSTEMFKLGGQPKKLWGVSLFS